MKLFDFRKREPPRVTPTPEPPPQAMEGREPEDVINAPWGFRPMRVTEKGAPVFSTEEIASLTAVASARALMSIAEDLAAIRKHMTRLQLVEPPLSIRSEPSGEPNE